MCKHIGRLGYFEFKLHITSITSHQAPMMIVTSSHIFFQLKHKVANTRSLGLSALVRVHFWPTQRWGLTRSNTGGKHKHYKPRQPLAGPALGRGSSAGRGGTSGKRIEEEKKYRWIFPFVSRHFGAIILVWGAHDSIRRFSP